MTLLATLPVPVPAVLTVSVVVVEAGKTMRTNENTAVTDLGPSMVTTQSGLVPAQAPSQWSKKERRPEPAAWRVIVSQLDPLRVHSEKKGYVKPSLQSTPQVIFAPPSLVSTTLPAVPLVATVSV